MKIGVFVSVVAGQKGFENNVSGHIQVPLRSIEELRKAGHEVHLITNKFGADRSLPFCLDKDMDIHFVTDSRDRKGILERKSQQGKGISKFKLLRQVKEIKRICKKQNLDVLHLYGYNRTAHLAGGLKLFGLKTPVFVTIFGTFFPERFSFLTKKLWNRIDGIFTATDYVKNNLEAEGLQVKQIKHGVIRDLVEENDGAEVKPKHRVLFWRDMTVENGADVALAAYENLATSYPDIEFTFAVRPHWTPIEGVDEIASKYDNITVHYFPYKNGITMPKLLMESFCVVMPIRRMSIDPQLVIAETLATGIPVIATDQRSNPEFIVEGETGFLVPIGDIDATTKALDAILSDTANAIEMGNKAKADIASRWNWNSYAVELVEAYNNVLL
jgi:glycosyltransferase involved in cell wall biosynthesis